MPQAAPAPRIRTPRPRRRALGDDPQIAALLASRNARLAPFWLNPQDAAGDGPFAGHSALVVDAEDRFTTMLAHQLRHLGLDARIVPWNEVTDAQLDDAELVVSGPGPGRPARPGQPADAADARRRGAPGRCRAARCSPCA